MVQGDFRTTIKATCVRCLEETEQALHAEFTELYVFQKLQTYEQDSEDEPELVLPEDGYIDLEPLLREYLLLEIPIKALCRSDCKGLCPVCGANQNDINCDHGEQPSSTSALYPLSPGSS